MIEEREGVRILEHLYDVPEEVSRLRGYGLDLAYDIETTDTDPITSRMVALQFKPKGKKATIIDVRKWSRDELRLLGSVLEPLFDGTVTLVGHNLKFDLSFALAQLGLGAHKAYDTMLAEQVIFGLGMSSAAEKKIHFGMADLAERYGIEVEKESRSWFIGLDTRIEEDKNVIVGTRRVPLVAKDTAGHILSNADGIPIVAGWENEPIYLSRRLWDEPFPAQQIRYMRQDVSVVHRIKEKQQAAIKEWGLGEVVDLENRALFSLVGVEVWGVQINREGWLSVIDRVTARMKELERVLHLGSEGSSGFDGLDVHVIKVRNEKYREKMKPYDEWVKARDAFVATRKQDWESGGLEENRITHITPGGGFKNWSDYKKAMLEWWYERNGKMVRPPGIKEGVNLGSWMQVRDGFNDLGIPVKSVSEDTLTPYLGQHPLVKVYLDYSEARKLVSVYGRERGKKDKAFIELLDASDRLRASYQQIGADTGRMSSYNPNFQQIPADGLGAELRRNVVPAPGYTFVIADFSNIELRIVAELSGDKFLLDAFASGEDVHAYTAIVMFNLDKNKDFIDATNRGEDKKKWTNSHDAVISGRTLENTSYRKIAKTINYMLLYGAGVKKLAAMLGVAEKDAKSLLSLYYETFATAIAYLKSQKDRLDRARKAGEKRVHAETRSGRRRWFDIPDYPKHPASKGQRLTVEEAQKWEEAVDEWRGQLASIKRQLANTPIQGLSADITKETVALWYEKVGYDRSMKLVAVIHDEMVLEVLPPFADIAACLLEEVMYAAMKKYLHIVDLGEVHAVQSSYWKH